MFSLFAGQCCRNPKIYAFEPIPALFDLLRINTALYGLDVKLTNSGISRETKTELFTYYPNCSVISGCFANIDEEREVVKSFLLNQQASRDTTAAASIGLIDELLDERLTTERFSCEFKTISSVIRENEIERIDLLKIDAEKSELDVLAGIDPDDWHKIKQLVVEVHDIGDRLDQITSLLQRHGFNLVVEQDALLKNTGIYNLYATRESKEPSLEPIMHRAGAEVTPPAYMNPDSLTDDLRQFLKGRIPEYMVPSAVVLLNDLPLTPNGKLDRRALPPPEEIGLRLKRGYVGPRTPIEAGVAGVWSQVLRVERVGINNNFFELGGHSLLAAQVVTRLRERFQLEIPLYRLFELPTVEGLAAWIETEIDSGRRLKPKPLDVAGPGRQLPLSFAQQRLWFLSQLDPGTCAFNIPSPMHLKGRLVVPVLQQSMSEIARRHETLRMTFKAVDGVARQIINEFEPLSIPVIDMRGLPDAAKEASVERLAREEALSPFDLSKGPLLRVMLLRLADEEYVALFTMHHIISDGWSIEVLISEIVALYNAYLAGEPSPLEELSLQYQDFAVWQQRTLQERVVEEHLSYWRQNLHAAPPSLDLPTDKPRPDVLSGRGRTQNMDLSPELSSALKALSQQQGATLFMMMLAALDVLLYRYSKQQDIVLGTDVANRSLEGTESLIGFFVNQLVLRTDLSNNPTFIELLARVREVALGAYTHQDLPFEKLVEDLNPKRSLNRTPLFQIKLVFQNAMREELSLPGLDMRPFWVDKGVAQFDLLITVIEAARGLILTAIYSTDLFEDSTITAMLKQFQTLLENIVANPRERISDLGLLTDSAKSALAALDLPKEDLSQKDLEDILMEIGERL
jgi:FkbM family methyltransferase